MKILIAPDSFKESLSAAEVADCIETGIKRADPRLDCIKIPMADGGEGTVSSVISATSGVIIKVNALDPIQREIDSFYGLTGDGQTAVIEMAAASGLERLKTGERNPAITSSYGTGQLIASAVKNGIKKIIIGLGGSATNDGGAGMAEALGVLFFDRDHSIIHPAGGNLNQIAEMDITGLSPEIYTVSFTAATDVNNPLCGPQGAAYVFSPQKGADYSMVEDLDRNLFHYGKFLEDKFRKSIINQPGSGAAGGLAASLMALFDIKIKSGFDILCDLTGFEEKVKEADLIITGEGRIDRQTYYGKTTFGVLKLGYKYKRPVIAITGNAEDSNPPDIPLRFSAIIPIIEKPCTYDFALANTSRLITITAERIINLISSV